MNIRFQGTILEDSGLKARFPNSAKQHTLINGAEVLKHVIEKSTKIDTASFVREQWQYRKTGNTAGYDHTATIATTDGRIRQFKKYIGPGLFSGVDAKEAKFIRKVMAFVESVERGEPEPGIGSTVVRKAKALGTGLNNVFGAIRGGLGLAFSKLKHGLSGVKDSSQP